MGLVLIILAVLFLLGGLVTAAKWLLILALIFFLLGLIGGFSGSYSERWRR